MATTSKVSMKVVWSVDLGGPTFLPYDPRVILILETARGASSSPSASAPGPPAPFATIGRNDYKFDLIAMTQTNVHTGGVRSIRRDLVVVPVPVHVLSSTIDFSDALAATKLKLPDPDARSIRDVARTVTQWTNPEPRYILPDTLKETCYAKVPVVVRSIEWDSVVKAAATARGVTVLDVYRIQNPGALVEFTHRLTATAATLADDRARGYKRPDGTDQSVETVLMWHGTTNSDCVHPIASKGIMPHFAGQSSSVNMYGKGAYFSPLLEVSDPRYTNVVSDTAGLRCAGAGYEVRHVFLASVITTGTRYYPVGDSSMVLPPYKPEPAESRHAGTSNGGSNPTIIVTYDGGMSLVQYEVFFANTTDVVAAAAAAAAAAQLALDRPLAECSAPVPAPVPIPAALGPAVQLQPVQLQPVLPPAPVAVPQSVGPIPIPVGHGPLKRTAADMLGTDGSVPLPMAAAAPPVSVSVATTTHTTHTTHTTSSTSSTTSTTSTSSTSSGAPLHRGSTARQAIAAVIVGARVRMRVRGYGEHAGTVVDVATGPASSFGAKCTVDWDDGSTSKVPALRCAAHLI
jgi:hypothetical protein